MPDSPQPEGKLTEAQVKAVLARALELQSASAQGATEEGLNETSVQQLSDAAAEIGVSAEFVRRAANEILSSTPQVSDDLVEFRRAELVVDRIFPGVLSSDDIPQLLEDLRVVVGEPGRWQAKQEDFSWQASALGLRIVKLGRNSRVEIRTPYASDGRAFVVFVTVTVTLFVWAFAVRSLEDPFAKSVLFFLAIFAGGLGAGLQVLTSGPFARARRMRVTETKQVLAAVTSLLGTEGQ